jgi:tRNA(Ile)-lysidine synthase
VSASSLRAQPSNSVKIITAHHQDDLVETILMNLIRGTGWRGLVPMSAADIVRPLLDYSKAELVSYAIKNKLQWVEDATNYSAKYFRNRVRSAVATLPPDFRRQILELNQNQTILRTEIEQILIANDLQLAGAENFLIEDLLGLPENVAAEVLRAITHKMLTTPQLKRLKNQLKTAKSGDIIEAGGNLRLGIYQGRATVSSLS